MKVEESQTNRVEDDPEAMTFWRAHSLSDAHVNKPTTEFNAS